VVSEDQVTLTGTIKGNVTVKPNSLLRLWGTIDGNLKVERDGIALIDGTVTGSVESQHAHINVSGRIFGGMTFEDETYYVLSRSCEINGYEWGDPKVGVKYISPKR
jgi:cytoskeletal protein CcmA (bactofilin family)